MEACAEQLLLRCTARNAGCSEDQIQRQANSIVHQSFKSTQATNAEEHITSASPHCSELPSSGEAVPSRTQSPGPQKLDFEQPHLAADSAQQSPSPDRLHAPEKEGAGVMDSPMRRTVSLDVPAAQALLPTSDLEPLDPLSLAARELMLLRQESQVPSALAVCILALFAMAPEGWTTLKTLHHVPLCGA